MQTPLALLFLCLLTIPATVSAADAADEETVPLGWDQGRAIQAVVKIEQRAIDGDVEAQNRLGNMFYYGDGIKKNRQQAFYWYEKAARQGNASAQFNLARFYRQGIGGVERDYALAADWYEKAAEQGLSMAQFFLGKIYAQGQGRPKDPVLAYDWLHRAALQGDIDAQWARDRLIEEMSPQQLTQVQTDWTAKPLQLRRADPGVSGTGATGAKTTPAQHEPQTRKKTGPKPSRAMVRAVQDNLTLLGFEPGPADGIPGSRTKAAITAFQTSAGLEPDGRISQELLDLLHESVQK